MAIQAVARPTHTSYLDEKTGILSWLLTTDHKRIGLLYTFSSILLLLFHRGHRRGHDADRVY